MWQDPTCAELVLAASTLLSCHAERRFCMSGVGGEDHKCHDIMSCGEPVSTRSLTSAPSCRRERAATKKLKRQLQQEKRGAMRELRKDSAFISAEHSAEKGRGARGASRRGTRRLGSAAGTFPGPTSAIKAMRFLIG